MKKILSLDGGGIRGVFAVQVLREVERIIQEKYGLNKDGSVRRLCDHFDLIAGTSTGAIIATYLSWGYSVDDIETLYTEHGKKMFTPHKFHGKFWSAFSDKPLKQILKNSFSEPSDDGGLHPATLGTDQLKTLILLVTLRSDTLSPWPLTNNRNAKFNNPEKPWNNLNIPLWQIVRASTAAPPYFPAQRIRLLEQAEPVIQYKDRWFLDGGTSSYNNPTALAIRHAILPPYHINWEEGPENLYVLSVGCGDPVSNKRRRKNVNGVSMNRVSNILNAIDALTTVSNEDQDTVCRMMGKTLFGHRLDIEVGDLIDPPTPSPRFLYTRYQKIYSREELNYAKIQGIDLGLSAVSSIDYLIEKGIEYARETVKSEHIR